VLELLVDIRTHGIDADAQLDAAVAVLPAHTHRSVLQGAEAGLSHHALEHQPPGHRHGDGLRLEFFVGQLAVALVQFGRVVARLEVIGESDAGGAQRLELFAPLGDQLVVFGHAAILGGSPGATRRIAGLMKSSLPIAGRPVRFALVGCGRISANHIAALEQHQARAELVAVCDNRPEALAAAVSRSKAPGFATLEALLADGASEADVVILATPSGLHPRQAMRAAAAGRHVLTEKPMATKWDEGMQMVRACRDAGVKLFVVKQNRLNPTMQLLKKTIEAGRFGRIFMVTVNVFWTRPQSYYDDAPWRGRWDLDGGAFLNQASHYVDMVDWLVGPVDNVHAYTATLARDIEAEDTGVMSLRLRKGGLASINVTMLAHRANFEGSITVIGERGTVRIGGVAVNQIQHWQFDERTPTINRSTP
jgi:UDP-N-acetyl-2-amino-2-deoxyglucuronate dehydrogenase